MLAARPEQPLKQDDKYFLSEYRVVQLHHIMELQEIDHEWEVFFGVNLEENSQKVTIVVPKTWAMVARDPALLLYTHFVSYFSFLC